MVDTEEIQVSFPCEDDGEDPENPTSQDKDEEDEEKEKEKKDTRTNGCMSKFKSWGQTIVIVVLLVLFCAVTGVLFALMGKTQSATTELQYVTNEVIALWNITEQLQIENTELKKRMNLSFDNCRPVMEMNRNLSQRLNEALSIISSETAENKWLRQLLISEQETSMQLQIENTELKVHLNLSFENCRPLIEENRNLSQRLNESLSIISAEMAGNKRLRQLLISEQETSMQLQIENTELKVHLNLSFENCRPLIEENRNLSQRLNESLSIISSEMAGNKQLRQLLISEKETSMQLAARNQKQHSILFSNHLTFLWRFCNKTTLDCTRCLPGWTEHARRCFILSTVTEKWEDARRVCRKMGGDLAVVFDAQDQGFLTNMTFQFAHGHPEHKFHSAWIGLQDMVKEGTHYWLNGDTVKWNVSYWKHMEPNNAVPDWDVDMAGQDCVAIVAPDNPGDKDWLNSWDDIVCAGKRHYLCETLALELV